MPRRGEAVDLALPDFRGIVEPANVLALVRHAALDEVGTFIAGVAQVFADMSLQKQLVDEFAETERRCPTDEDPGFDGEVANEMVAELTYGTDPDGSCTIQVVLSNAERAVAGERIRFERVSLGEWEVRSSIGDRHLPARYRGQPRL